MLLFTAERTLTHLCPSGKKLSHLSVYVSCHQQSEKSSNQCNNKSICPVDIYIYQLDNVLCLSAGSATDLGIAPEKAKA